MRTLIASILLLFFVTNAYAQETPVVVPLTAPVFDADKADNMVVRITNLKGEFRATGFYIGDNIVVTANHVTVDTARFRTPMGVIAGPTTLVEHLLIWDKAGEVTLGTVKYRDEKQDVATIVIDATKLTLTAVTFAASPPKRGDRLFMIGHPVTFGWTLSRGYLARGTQTLPDGEIRALASFLGTNGSSGSPVFNERGELVGLATQVFRVGAGVLYAPISLFQTKVLEVE